MSRVVVITGGANGIGRATALAFAELGDTVVSIDVDEAANETLAGEVSARGGTIEAHTVDVTDRAAVRVLADDVTQRHGAVHVLFNNAGITAWASTEETDDDLWDRVLDVNLTSAVTCTRAFLPALKRAGVASIVHNSSIDGILGNPRLPAYSMAKGAMTPMTHVMAQELGRFGIRVNCVAPGGIAGTGLSSPIAAEYVAALQAATPLARWGRPEEVASVVVFLASDGASYLNGVVIPIDGGRTGLTQGTI